MSAIFGVIHLDDSPVAHESIISLGRAHAHWGPDGVDVWREGPAGLGVALRFETPEASASGARSVRSSDDSVTAVIARLDNREELCEQLDIPAAERPHTADDELAHLAYRHWGEACAPKLLGDWSMAVWRPAERRLFIARDQLNVTGLYYFHRPSLFVFASDIQALAHAPEVASPIDEWQLARYVVMFPGDLDRTMWRDIRLLRPAHTLSCTPSSLRLDEYWTPENVAPIRLGSTAEYVEGFLDRYRRAVHARLRSVGPVGTTLSAGLDSSSVTALAAERLRSEGKRLTAFTSVPVHGARHLTGIAIADEGPLAAETASWCGNIDHVLITGREWTPTAALERLLEYTAQPNVGPGNAFWLLSLLSAARERGLKTLLFAHMGNATVSWAGGSYRELFLFIGGRWVEAVRTLASWRDAHATTWATAIKYQIAAPLLAQAWVRRGELLGRESPWASRGALNPAFAARLGLDREMRKSAWFSAVPKPMPPRAERSQGLKLNAIPAGTMQHALGAGFDVSLRDPTADVRLVEYCLGVPDDQYVTRDGSRLLVRRAMTGLLPPAVQWNVQRGRQGADVLFRLLEHREEMDRVLTRFEASPAVTEYLDVGRLRETWTRLQAEGVTPGTFKEVNALLFRGLIAAFFVERHVARGGSNNQ